MILPFSQEKFKNFRKVNNSKTYDDLVAEFTNYCKVSGKMCTATEKAYAVVHKLLRSILCEKYSVETPLLTHVKDITSVDLVNYLAEGSVKANTRRRRFFVWKKFFKFLLRSKYITEDPMDWLPNPKSVKGEPRPIDMETFMGFIRWLSRAHVSTGVKGCIFFMIDTGCRVSEALNLTSRDIQRYNKTNTQEGGYKIRLYCKGGKVRHVFVSNRKVNGKPVNFSYQYIRSLLNEQHTTTLFGASYRDVRSVISKFSSNTTSSFTPHQLRHTFATLVLRGSANNISVTQRAMGHASPVTTQVYAEYFDDGYDTEVAKARMQGLLQHLSDSDLDQLFSNATDDSEDDLFEDIENLLHEDKKGS